MKLVRGLRARQGRVSLEGNIRIQIKLQGLLVGMVREHCFHEAEPGEKQRRWKFDFAWPQSKVAIEAEGGTFGRGRHNRGVGYRNDCEKYNEATFAGWMVIRISAGTKKKDIRRTVERVGFWVNQRSTECPF